MMPRSPGKKTFAEIMLSYLGKPYARGAMGPAAYDCIGFVYAFLRDTGKGACFPHEFEDYSLETYPDLYERDREAAEQLMLRAFRTIGSEISPQAALAGDLLIVQHQNGGLFPAIYAGNSMGYASFLRAGVRAFNLDRDNKAIMARRLD